MDKIIKMPMPEPHQPKDGYRERPDPTEWRPRDNRDYETKDIEVPAMKAVSEPLNYQSLAQFQPGVIEGIERTALADLRQAMNRTGLHPDERSLRVEWQLRVVGRGFQAPEGFIHPEAPEDIQRESQAAWKRCVEMASDSLSQSIFVRVWRRRKTALPGKPKEIEG